jgi:hypothetical protein
VYRKRILLKYSTSWCGEPGLAAQRAEKDQQTHINTSIRQSLEIRCGSDHHDLQVILGLAPITRMAGTVATDHLGDGSLNARPDTHLGFECLVSSLLPASLNEVMEPADA